MRRRLIWLGLLTTGVVLAVTLARPARPLPVVVLPDGTKLTVRAVTVSRHPKFCFGGFRQRLGAKLPGKLGQKLSGGMLFDAGDQGEPVLTLWFSLNGTNSYRRIAAAVKESKGAATVSFTQRGGVRTLPSQELVGCVVFEAWPRREKELHIQIIDRGRTTELISILNPVHRRYPQWKPDSLPATRRAGDTEFRMLGLRVGTNTMEFRNSFFGDLTRSAELFHECKENGETSRNWEPHTATLLDATGNWITGGGFGFAGTPFPGHWPVMPGEQAVRLQVQFIKTNGFASNEVFTLRGIPANLVDPYRTNLPQGRLALYSSAKNNIVIPRTPLRYPTNDFGSRPFLLLSVVDEVGRPQKIQRHSYAEILDGAKTLEITVAAPRVEWVEWTVPAAGTVTNEAGR